MRRRLAVMAASAVAVLGLTAATAGTADAAGTHHKLATLSVKGAKITGYWYWNPAKTKRWLHTTIYDTAADKRSAGLCFTTGATKPSAKSTFSCLTNSKGAHTSRVYSGWAAYANGSKFAHFWYSAAAVNSKKHTITKQSAVKKAW
jgi:hypothetical protein